MPERQTIKKTPPDAGGETMHVIGNLAAKQIVEKGFKFDDAHGLTLFNARDDLSQN